MPSPFDLTKSNTNHKSSETLAIGRLVTRRFDASKQNLAQNEVAQLIAVKAFDYVMNVTARVITADAASTTCDIGDGATTDGYIDGMDTATANATDASMASAEAFAKGKMYAADDTIDLKAMHASGLTTGVIEVTALIIPMQAHAA
jgi:hypothetical protein